MPIQLRGGHTTEDPRLDRIPKDDERNRLFPIRTLIKATRLRSYTWAMPPGMLLDQGQDGACEGFAWCHELAARPRPVTGVTNEYARDTYWNIQRNDEWPGGAYPGADPQYDGTATLDAVKYLTSQGWYDEYRWAETEEDLALTIGHHGPAVLGIPWHEAMFEPDEDGLLTVAGDLAGYHAILARGISLKRDAYLLRQSWGEWGIGGDCWVRRADMGKLISRDVQGEACVPVVRMPRMSV